MPTPFAADPFAQAQKAQIDSLLTLAHTAFAGMEQMAALNLHTARSLLEDSTGSAQALLSAKDLPSLLALQSKLLQPSVDKAALWSRSAYEIGAATRTALDQTLEAQRAAAGQTLDDTLNELVKHAPAGTEAAARASVGALKSAIGAASSAYDTFSKVAKQASEYAESHSAPVAKPAAKARKAA